MRIVALTNSSSRIFHAVKLLWLKRSDKLRFMFWLIYTWLIHTIVSTTIPSVRSVYFQGAIRSGSWLVLSIVHAWSNRIQNHLVPISNANVWITFGISVTWLALRSIIHRTYYEGVRNHCYQFGILMHTRLTKRPYILWAIPNFF